MENKQRYTFPKSERLCLKTQIDELFAQGKRLRGGTIWCTYRHRQIINVSDPCCKVLISVPKRQMAKAVHRNLIKRRMREAYRLNKHQLTETLYALGRYINIGFVYNTKTIQSFDTIEKEIKKHLETLKKQLY